MSYQQELAKAARERKIRLYGNNLMPIVRISPSPVKAEPPPPVYEPRQLPILSLSAVQPLRPTAASIVELVASVHDVSSADIVGKRRTSKIVDARAHAIAVLCEFRPDMSLPHIGRILDLDHTTIIYHRDTWPTKRAGRCQREIAAVYEQLEPFTRLEKDAEPMIG